MTTHARLSPSSADRWFNCPGSVRECAKYPNTSSPAAIDGTHTHTLLEHCLKAIGNFADPLKMVGIKLTDRDGEFEVDAKRAKRVEIALNYIKTRIEELGAFEIRPESKVNAGLMIERDDIKGTADVQIMSDDTLEIIDYKDGMGIVEPEGNKQMSIYAMGAMIRKKSAMGYPFTKVRLTIIQPKLVVKGFEAVRHWDTTVENILKFAEVVKQQAALTDDPEASLIPGDAQCKWCPHKGACGAFTSKNMEGVSLMFNDVAKQAADKEPTELTDEQIREIVESAPSVRQMLEAVEKEAQRRIESGTHIEGLKIVRTSGRRGWAYPEEEMADKLRRMQIPKTALYVVKLVSPTQIESLSWEKKDGTTKQLSERQMKTLQSEYVTKSAGGLKVVPESTRGEKVVFNVAPMFSNQESDIPEWMK